MPGFYCNGSDSGRKCLRPAIWKVMSGMVGDPLHFCNGHARRHPGFDRLGGSWEKIPESEQAPKHPNYIAGYEDHLDDLAHRVANMQYDHVAEFFRLLAAQLDLDAGMDAEKGRAQLAALLRGSVRAAEQLAMAFDGMWRVCELHMQDKAA